MSYSGALSKVAPTESRMAWLSTTPLKIHPVINQQREEVLTFLASRPLHTVFMAGLIRDNGLVSRLNRGSFYACRDAKGYLEGVALIGHATLVEARSEASLRAFARLAQEYRRAHVIMGERDKIQHFWNYYSAAGQSPRLACRELLLELRWPAEVREQVDGLRQASSEHLEPVMQVQAQLAYEESGVNPLEADPVGFRRRCVRRVEQGRVWVWAEGERLIFKADIISDTPEVIYLEGLYVHPEERGKGYGLRCLSQLSRSLVARAGSVCVLVNEQNQRGQNFYRRAGYKLQSCYDTIYLRNSEPS
ncbi:MAG TPA: GNAT family N-acetyltransferase [Pyrinomonadaceae bacterium]|jgi:predicted GNAT family acetyltransferase|nr:GNAT family N-acetyltransferase [Pyrinomonadaceae bacterium]